jgi:hypothetical protein
MPQMYFRIKNNQIEDMQTQATLEQQWLISCNTYLGLG